MLTTIAEGRLSFLIVGGGVRKKCMGVCGLDIGLFGVKFALRL